MKLLIWGTGGAAEEVWNNQVSGEVIGFVESKKTKENCMGYPVYGIEQIPKGWDFIIVANNFSDEIHKVCLEHNVDMTKVVFLKRGRTSTYNADKRIRQVLGEINYTKYAIEYGEWKNTFIEDDMKKYSSLNKRNEFSIDEKRLYPIISDKYSTNSGFDDYFWMDLWAAKHIISSGIKEHYDIGSSVCGLIAHLLAAGITVNAIDVRPFLGECENLHTITDDATMLNQFEDNSILSLSAMCSLEHFGLGRYGDPIDPEACFKCFEQIQKKLKTGGKLFISLPVGIDGVAFNAHRIFCASTVLSCFDRMKLMEYSIIRDRKIEYNIDIHTYDHLSQAGTGLFYFEK